MSEPADPEAALLAYRAAKEHAEFTDDLMDIVAAEVAWRTFIRLFHEDKNGREKTDERRRCFWCDEGNFQPPDVLPEARIQSP